jgi:hypothetical protein
MCQVIQRNVKPRFLTQTAFHDVAGNIGQPHCPQRHPQALTWRVMSIRPSHWVSHDAAVLYHTEQLPAPYGKGSKKSLQWAMPQYGRD